MIDGNENPFFGIRVLILHCVTALLNIQSTNAPGNFHPTTKMTYFRRFSSYGFFIYFPDHLLSIKCIFCNITTYVNFIVLCEQVKKDKQGRMANAYMNKHYSIMSARNMLVKYIQSVFRLQ